MKQKILLFIVLIGVIPATQAQTRDPLKWPFQTRSIWNLPIHNNATYVSSGLTQANSNSFSTDEDIIIFSPNSPNMNVETNYTDWNAGGDARCPDQGPTLFSAPIPSSWIFSNANWQGSTPNSGASILRTDGKIIQTQPFAKCNADFATSHYVWSADNCVLTGECIAGAHGGSGMSTVGGTIRVGEFTAGVIRHALKFNVWGKFFLSNSNGGYRWPALAADGGYNDPNSFNYYGGSNAAMKMGSLVALHKTANLSTMGFETTPGMILAKAFKDYGAYIVDNTGWNHCAIPTETGPNGSVLSEFESLYGFSFHAWDNLDNTAWGRDIKRIITNLYVIDNNNSTNIGGGPTNDNNRRNPVACAIGSQGTGNMCGIGAIPGRTQAENFASMSGIQVEGTSDSGGGSNVGYIDANDWMDYAINVPLAGTYAIRYRVATPLAGKTLQLKNGTTVLHTISVPNTGGWQTWSTVSGLATLPAGNLTLRLTTTSGGFNFNWFEGAVPVAVNKVLNPGFEAEGATQTPSNWGEWNAVSAAYTESGGGSKAGSYHLTHWSSSAYEVSNYQGVTGLTNGTYTLSAWVQSSGGQTSVQLIARNYGGSADKVANIAASSTWTKVTITGINVTNGQCEIHIHSKANAGNWATFDEISLTLDGSGARSATERLESVEETSVASNILDVFPVPAKDQLTIVFNSTVKQQIQLTISDMSLRPIQVLNADVDKGENRIVVSTTSMSNGVYLITIPQPDKRIIRKIVISK
jgi:hypothetical protein